MAQILQQSWTKWRKRCNNPGQNGANVATILHKMTQTLHTKWRKHCKTSCTKCQKCGKNPAKKWCMCCNNLAQNVKSVAKILHKMMQILQQSCTTCQKLSKNPAQNGANNP